MPNFESFEPKYERLITPEDLEAEGIPEPVINRILGIIAVEGEVEQPTLF